MAGSLEGLHTATVRIDTGEHARLKLQLGSVRLRVVDGPDAGLQRTVQVPLVRIGSGEDCDLVLSDPTVSRQHAELQVNPEGLKLRDLQSTNGTFVGSLKVSEVVLSADTECRFGSSKVLVQIREETYVGAIDEADRFGDLVGASRAMRELYGLIRAAAPTQATILVTGESGPGKELVAHKIHQESGRAGPLVAFDAGASDPEMIRSDLFGHLKGAFTGAAEERKGAFREADRGTLFLDEVGELPLDLQPRLLRVLESRQVAPIGSDRPVRVDVRVVAATHRDLPAMVKAGKFREDLLHRLAVVPIVVPALRERGEDIPLLVRTLTQRAGLKLEIEDEALEVMAAYPWPGNVRALRNALERLAILVRGRPVRASDLDLPELSPTPAAGPSEARPKDDRKLAEIEREAILAGLARHKGNKAAAARALGIGITTLKRKLQEYGVDQDPPAGVR